MSYWLLPVCMVMGCFSIYISIWVVKLFSKPIEMYQEKRRPGAVSEEKYKPEMGQQLDIRV